MRLLFKCQPLLIRHTSSSVRLGREPKQHQGFFVPDAIEIQSKQTKPVPSPGSSQLNDKYKYATSKDSYLCKYLDLRLLKQARISCSIPVLITLIIFYLIGLKANR